MSWTQQAELVLSDPEEGASFGNSVAIYGDTAIVGAPGKDVSGGTITDSGSAYIFTRSGNNWTLKQQLVPSNPETNSSFGQSVSIYNNTVIVGAPYKDISGGTISDGGSAYIFDLSGTTWIQQAELIPSDLKATDYFGQSVSIYGDTAIVGAPLKDTSGGTITDSGSTYIYTRSGTNWILKQQLVPSNSEATSTFGQSVAIYNNTVIVGEPYKDISGGTISDGGSAYIFDLSGTNWIQQQQLIPLDPEANANFGYSVTIYGDTAIIGAPYKDTSGGTIISSGSAYIFVRTGTNWIQQQQLVPSNPEQFVNFGWSVGIYMDTVIVGTPFKDYGISYIFIRCNSIWNQQQLIESDTSSYDIFGNSVGIYSNTIIVGAPFNPVYSGKAYIFVLEQQPPEQEIVAEEACLCSQKPCAQLSYTGLTETEKITNIADNRAIATSFTINNIPNNVRGRQFPSFADYLRYQQAQLKYY